MENQEIINKIQTKDILNKLSLVIGHDIFNGWDKNEGYYEIIKQQMSDDYVLIWVSDHDNNMEVSCFKLSIQKVGE